MQLIANASVVEPGWNAFTSERKKPQVKAQLTYFRSSKVKVRHDLKFGFEDIHDWARSASTGSRVPTESRSIRPAPLPASGFADVGAPGGYGSAWTTSANVDQHYAGYIQDRWAPNNRLTISAGVRASRLSEPRLHHGEQRYPGRGWRGRAHRWNHDLFRIRAPYRPEPCLRTRTPRRGSVSATPSTRSRRRCVEGVYGRYYNNSARRLLRGEPGRHELRRVRLQRTRTANGLYATATAGAGRAGSGRASASSADAGRPRNVVDAVHRPR